MECMECMHGEKKTGVSVVFRQHKKGRHIMYVLPAFCSTPLQRLTDLERLLLHRKLALPQRRAADVYKVGRRGGKDDWDACALCVR